MAALFCDTCPMRTILVVEDDDDIREGVCDILRHEGYDVREAEHGKRALETLEAMDNEPCLVLLDLMMPVMNGPELLQILQETHRLASLPIVVISAGGSPDDAPGATKFMRKPASIDLLLHLVGEFCGPPARGSKDG